MKVSTPGRGRRRAIRDARSFMAWLARTGSFQARLRIGDQRTSGPRLSANFDTPNFECELLGDPGDEKGDEPVGEKQEIGMSAVVAPILPLRDPGDLLQPGV